MENTKTTKRNNIIYWVATLWLCLGMTSTGIMQIFKIEQGLELTNPLMYPPYFLTIIGIWKLLGVAAVLLPGLPLVKEWAYAGFFFVSTGAVFSHLSIGQTAEILPGLLLLTLTVLSWYYRPASRRIVLR